MDSQHRFNHRRSSFQANLDAVTVPHPEGGQVTRKPVGASVKLAVSEPTLAVHHGVAVPVPCDGFLKELMEAGLTTQAWLEHRRASSMNAAIGESASTGK